MSDTYEYWDLHTDEPLIDSDLDERYADMLDECATDSPDGLVHIGELSYAPSKVLRAVDPIAYRVGFSDWLDSELGETITDTEPENEEI